MFHTIHSIAQRERGRKSNSPRERALREYRIRKAAEPSAQYAGERDAEEPLGNFLTTGCATWEQFARPVTFLSSTVNGYSGRVRPYVHARARSFFADKDTETRTVHFRSRPPSVRNRAGPMCSFDQRYVDVNSRDRCPSDEESKSDRCASSMLYPFARTNPQRGETAGKWNGMLKAFPSDFRQLVSTARKIRARARVPRTLSRGEKSD
jgi:hypothetical protein